MLSDRSLINGSLNAAANTSFQGSIERPHQHVFLAAGNWQKDVPKSFFVPCAFPVREVRVKANYAIFADSVDSWYAVSDMPAFAEGGGVCMGFNTSLAYESKTDTFITSGGFGNTELAYILRQPMLLQGNWNITLRSTGIAALAFDADIILDFEFLG